MSEHGIPNQMDNVADLLGGQFPGHVMQRVRTADGKYRYGYVSAGVQASFGLDPQTLMKIDAVDHDWVHPDDRARFLAELEHSAATLTPLDTEVRVAAPKGGYKWVRSLGQPRRVDDGSTIWDGVALDVTDRREALDALERALQDARRSEVTEGRFAYIAAHDLLSPLGDLRRALANLQARATQPDGTALRPEVTGVAEAFATFEKALIATRELVNATAATAPDQPGPDPVPGLTTRQREILTLIRQGASNRQIAGDLGISEGTVKLHVSAMFKRLGVRNRTEAANMPL